MRRSILTVLAAAVLAFSLLSFCFHWLPYKVLAFSFVPSLVPVVTPPTLTPTPTASTHPTISLDPAVWAAIIGLGGVIIGAVIAGAFAIYQMRRTAQIEKKRQEDQFKHDEEMERMQKELEAQYETKRQEQQNNTANAEALRLKMLLSPSSERTKTYREALHADPRISQLQILDMNRPLDISNIYVRVRVHQETRSHYELDAEMRRAELQRDPNALIQARFKYIEQRSSSAMDPDEAIRTYKRCVFVGDPGAGKTTLLKYLTLKSADGVLDKLPDLPVRVELNAFVISGYHDLLDYVAADWDACYGFPKSEARIAIEECLKDGNALLLLDALDETVVGGTIEEAEKSYQHVTEMIQRLATRYPQVPIVVTARKAGYQQRSQLTGFTELEVLDFRSEDIQLFVTNWFDCYTDPQKKANGNELNAKLARNPRIQSLAANPLLLSLIVLVYEAQLDLPDRRAELYKRCVEVLLREWDAKRNIRRRREFRPEHKQQLLGEIAWHFHLQGKRYFPEAELLQLVADFLPTIRLLPEQNGLILAEIANEHGLLKEQARGWQGFLHLTLQEYFVAQYITDHQQQQLLLSHCGDPWWEEVTQLHAGLSTDISLLLHTLLGDRQTSLSLPEDIFYTNLITAGRCLAASPTIKEVVLWENVVERLFEVLVTTPYALTYQSLAEVLVAIGSPETHHRLISLLSNEQLNANVREQIANAVGQLGDHSDVPTLLALLSNEQLNANVRRQIANAVGQLGDHSDVPTLLTLLSNEQLGENVGWRIANAVGQLGDHSDVPTLLTLLSSENVGWFIAYAVGQLGDHSDVPALLTLLSNERLDGNVGWWIADAVGQLGDHSDVPTLLTLLSNEQFDSLMRMGVAYAVGELGDHSDVPTLLTLLSDKQLDANVREVIANAVGKLGDHSDVPTLFALLTDKQLNANMRRQIANAVGELGDHSDVPTLLTLLSDKQLNADVREQIANAVGQLGDHSDVPTLLTLLSDKQLNADVRGQIANRLQFLVESEEDMQSLLILLSSSDIADHIYRALWILSLRMGVRIVRTNAAQRQLYQIVKWSTAS